MVTDQLKITTAQLIEQVQRLGLTNAQKKNCSRLLKQNSGYINDPRVFNQTLMEELENRPLTVYPGMAVESDEMETLFIQMNYYRMRLSQLKEQILDCGTISIPQVRELLRWNNLKMATSSKIVTANMGLVMAMARFVNYAGVEFTELISDGGVTLMRASDKFDYMRGCKFSTYACRAILRTMSRTARLCYRHRKMFPAQLEPRWEKMEIIDNHQETAGDEIIEEIKVILEKNLACLTPTEQAVIKLRFPFLEDKTDRLTLKQAGHIIGLSKERIRQIQNKSLLKLRGTMQQRFSF